MIRLVAISVFAGLLLMGAASADQDDPRLEDLFAHLEEAEDADAATRSADKIWQIWLDSGREEANLLMARGQVFLTEGHPQAALDDFSAVTRLAPDFAEGWNKRATVHYMLGRYEASLADVDRTLALEPRHFGALSGLGLINLRLGKERAALAAFRRALAVHPFLPAARLYARQLGLKLEGKRI